MIYEKPEHQILKIANKLYRMRIDSGRSLKELSELTTMPIKTLEDIEHGFNALHIFDLIKLLAVYRSNLHDFFAGDDF